MFTVILLCLWWLSKCAYGNPFLLFVVVVQVCYGYHFLLFVVVVPVCLL